MSVSLDMAKALGEYPTATLFEASGRKGAMSPAIKPLALGTRMAGPAFTVRCAPDDNLAIHRALGQAPAGAVLVIATGQAHDGSYCGGIISLAAKLRGLAGIVLDGRVRDSGEMRSQGFPVFCRGSAISGAKKQDPGELQTQVVCAGIEVHPGDLVVGDDDGVIVLPASQAEPILAAARKRDEWEHHMVDGLTQGRTTLELLGIREQNP